LEGLQERVRRGDEESGRLGGMLVVVVGMFGGDRVRVLEASRAAAMAR